MKQHSIDLDPASLSRVLDVTRLLARPAGLDETLNRVIDAAREVLHAERGTVFLFDRETNELFVEVGTGVREIRFPATAGIAGQCAQSRQVINVPDCYADGRFNPEIDRRTGYRTRCMLSVPLVGFDDELVGVLQLLNKEGGPFAEQDEAIATALAAQAAVVLQRAQLLEERVRKEKMERDLELARDIQRRCLPDAMPKLDRYEVAGWSRPAEETGGDIYDVVQLDDGRVLIMMGDATGHGIGPALSVTQARAMVRIAMRLGADLDRIFNFTNDQLAEDLADNRFVTAFIGILDLQRDELAYHSGGQGPLLLYQAAGDSFQQLGASSMPMGIMAGLDARAPDPLPMQPGDIFALISDGIFEAADGERNQFEVGRVCEVIRSHAHASPLELAGILAERVDAFVSGRPQADDMTIVIVKRTR